MAKVARWLRWLFVVLLVVILLLFALVYWLLHQQRVVDFAVQQLEQMLPELSVENARGTLADGISIESLRWEDPAVRVNLTELQLRFRLGCFASMRVCFESLKASELLLNLPPQAEDADATTDTLSLPEIPLPVSLTVDHLGLERLVVETGGEKAAPLLALNDISARVHWLLYKLSFRHLRLSYLLPDTSEEYGVVADGHLRFRSDYPLQASLQVRTPTALGNANLKVSGDLGSLSLSGGLSGEWPVVFDASLAPFSTPLSWQAKASINSYTLDLPQSEQLGFQHLNVDLQGEELSIKGTLRTDITTSRWQGKNHLNADLQFNDRELKIESFTLKLPEGVVKGSGNLASDTGFINGERNSPFHGSAGLRLKGINPELFFAGLNEVFRGQYAGQIQLNYQFSPDDFALRDLDLNLTELQGSLAGQPVSGSGQVRWQQAQGLMVKAAVLRQGENHIELRNPWQQSRPLDLALSLPQLDKLNDLVPGNLAGEASGALSLHLDNILDGNAELPTGTGKISITGFQYDDLHVESATITADSSRSVPYTLQLNGNGLRYQAQTLEQLRVSLQGDREDFALSAFSQSAELGELELDCRGSDLSRILNQNTTIRCDQLQWTPVESWPIKTWKNAGPVIWEMNIPEENFVLQPLCFREQRAGFSPPPEICAERQVRWDAGSADISGTANHLVWAQIEPLLTGDWQAEGSFNGSLEVKIRNSELNELQAKLQSPDSELRLPVAERQLVIPLTELQAEVQGTLQQASLKLTVDAADYGRFLANLQIDEQKILQGDINVAALQLQTLQPFFAEVTALEGVAEGILQLGGTIEKPSVKGDMAIKDGRVEHLALPAPVTRLQLQTSFDSFRANYEGTAYLRDAKATLSGHLDWRQDPVSASLSFSSGEIEITPLPRTDIWIVPDITADYENDRLTISGRVRVPRAFINIKALPKNSVGVSSDVVIVGSEQPQTEMLPVYANVDLRLGQDVLFRGFGLESHLRGNMRLEYSPQQLLQGNGFVKLVDGTYKAYGQNLEIRSGELIFVGPIDNPTIYVDAVRADITDAVTVGIRAEGPAKNPSVTLFSQPAMSDNRKLHYLVTGQAPGEGEPQDSSALLSQAAISLGAATGESVLQDYADKLGIRNFQISAGEGESGAEVQLSGYINPRLFVRYGMGMFEEVNSLTMRYKLTRNLFLEAVSSTASTLDLLWTFKVGKSERSLRE